MNTSGVTPNRLFPTLPFSALFEPDASIRDTSNFFYKTSVDYTLGTNSGNPIMAIDFDGLGEGCSRYDEYVQGRETKDPYRKWKFDFKLRYAKRWGLPYYVVSYDEMSEIGDTPKMAVVQGIIGYEIARREFHAQIQGEVRRHELSINALPDQLQYDYIGDLVSDLEYGLWLQHSPMEKRTGEVFTEIENLGGDVTVSNFVHRFEPDLPEDPPGVSVFGGSVELFKARLAAMENASKIGSICSLTTSIGEVSEVAWLRNIGNFSQSMRIVNSIAELFAHEKCLRLLKRKMCHSHSR